MEKGYPIEGSLRVAGLTGSLRRLVMSIHDNGLLGTTPDFSHWLRAG